MSQDERQAATLVDPSRGQVWRAGLPYHLIGLCCVLFFVVAPQNGLQVLWLAFAVFLIGVGRSVAWLLGVGAYSVVDTGASLALVRRGKIVQAVPWSGIRRVGWGGGSRFPSVDDPVSFPTLEISPVSVDGDLVMQPILVLGRQAREQAAKVIDERCRRHGLSCEISGPDKGLSVILLGRLRRVSRQRK